MSLQIGDLQVEVVRKRMRTLRLTVYAAGRIRVAVPLRTSAAAVEAFVLARRDWIQKHQQQFAARPAAAPLQYVSGETLYYLGQSYTLVVEPAAARPQVVLDPASRQLRVSLAPGSTVAQRAAVLAGWYRQQLKHLLPQLLAKWEPVVGRRAAAWGVKQMRTRWGTCNIAARRIWLNLELVKRPLPCLEYVLVHELVHLHERLHNARFWGLMNQFMPDWRQHRAELNRTPLSSAMPADAD